jgi:hypothetical protein
MLLSTIAPASAFSTAVAALRSSDTAMTLSLESTPPTLQAVASRAGVHLSRADADKFLSSSLTISSAAGSRAIPHARLLLRVRGKDVIELRSLGEALYVRADVRSLLRVLGADPAMADRAAELGRVAGLEFVAPAVEGCWLALDGAAPLGEHLSHSWGLVRPPDRALEGLAAALGARARVEAVGQDAAGTHLEIASPCGRSMKSLWRSPAIWFRRCRSTSSSRAPPK